MQKESKILTMANKRGTQFLPTSLNFLKQQYKLGNKQKFSLPSYLGDLPGKYVARATTQLTGKWTQLINCYFREKKINIRSKMPQKFEISNQSE